MTGASAAPQTEPDAWEGFIALTAFNGAVIGLVGTLCASLAADLNLSLIAGCGCAVCAWLWKRSLIDAAHETKRGTGAAGRNV